MASASPAEGAKAEPAEAPPPEQQIASPLPPPPRPEDLIAKGIAPVKPQYLCSPSALRVTKKKPPAEDVADLLPEKACAGEKPIVHDSSNGKGESRSVVAKEKKSKRQLKRERQEERKTARNLCPEIARTEDVLACQYGSGCRFSHDLDGFLKQKPEDLPGLCPFASAGNPCPYGVACRFSKSHSPHIAASAEHSHGSCSEVNVLSKDLQRLLWKDKVEFPNANAQLKLLGLLGDKNSKKSKPGKPLDSTPSCVDGACIVQKKGDVQAASTECSQTACLEGDSLVDNSDMVEARPPKKSKLPSEEGCSAAEAGNCAVHVESIEDEVARTEIGKGGCHKSLGSSTVEVVPVTEPREKKLIDFRGKLYLAPLTTVGNLPFRRVCKYMGADITCGEMAMCTNLLQGQASEWALLRRHSSEDLFGVQICGAYPDTVSRTVELIGRECSIDFIDINMGCPIDIVVNKGAGSALLTKPMRMKNIIQVASATIDKPLTVKVRTGFLEGRNRIDSLVDDISKWGAIAVTIHGRSRQQRYSKLADWNYIEDCVRQAPESLQILGNGDIFSYLDWNKHLSDSPKLSTCMIARGALIKPWIFTEIKEQRHWDITSGERLEILRKYVNFGLEHWGSDSKGVETTRYFLLEWLSYTCRYVPVGLLDVVPQRLNWRLPSYFGRDNLETLMASDSAADWVKISEMLLGKVPDGFTFAPKHKSNAYDATENG